MALPWLLEPVSPDAPCGPDLEKADHDEFLDYYFEAEGRLPERYFTPGVAGVDGRGGTADRVFDPKSVEHKAERGAIEALLKQSRDLRLLSLLARWEILAGRLTGFADAVQGAADLLETHPDDVHPVLEGGTSDRRGALEELASSVTVVFPLHHLPLNGQADITYRRYLVGSGGAEARSYEDDANAGQITSGLQEPGSKAAVDKTHADLSRAADALSRIARACKSHPSKPFTIDISPTLGAIEAIQDLIRQARPELEVWSAGDAPDEDSTEDEAAGGETEASQASPTPANSVAHVEAAGAIAGHNAAKVTLQAIEAYLAKNEPSSAALLLVTQARLLIGKPLIEALETLLPGEAARATIDFGPAHGFALPMERLRSLAAEHGQAEAAADTPAGEPPALASRTDVAAHIRSVEDFYRRNEPTSPIPLLLVRARSYLDKDFEAIVAELLPAPKQNEGG